MGFLFRAAIVIGFIYAASPLRDPGEPALPQAARDGLTRGGASLAGAAMAYCRQDPASCLGAASQANAAAQVQQKTVPASPAAPPPSASTASAKPAGAAGAPAPRKISLTPEPREKPRPAP